MTVTHAIGRRSYPVQSGRIVRNVLPTIILVDKNIRDAQYLALLELSGKETTPQEEFTWDVDEHLAFLDTTSATATAVATTINVTNVSYFNVGQLWKVSRTGEIFRVDSTNESAGTIGVQRAVTALSSSGGTAAAAMVNGDSLIKLAAAVGENSTRQITQTTTANSVSNFCTMLRYDLSLSDRQIKRKNDTGDEMPYQEMKALKEAQMSLNRLFWESEKARWTASDGDIITTTQGMLGVPTSNIFAVGGTLYEADLDDFLMDEGLRRGGDKALLASSDFIKAVTQIAKERIQYTQVNFGTAKAAIGIQVIRYMAPNGKTLSIMEDRHLSEAHPGTAVGIDLQMLKRKEFTRNGREGGLHLVPNTQNPDDMGAVSTLYADMGIWYGAEQNHFKITGVTGGAANRAQV